MVADEPQIDVKSALESPDVPPKSADGGNQEEFEQYWAANNAPLRLEGGWLERKAHPQLKIEKYWFNEKSGQTVFARPDAAEIDGPAVVPEFEDLRGEGPAWNMSIMDLKKALANEEENKLGLSYRELARRAVFTYEEFVPRVLSWHDYQHLTFWFFGGMDRPGKVKSQGGKGGFSNTGNEDLFAPAEFFREAATLIRERIGRMHPICLTYFVWTFVRAGVVDQKMLAAVGDHCCRGIVPMMDRCSLGTMLWNYGKLKVSHEEFFEVAAVELSRPNRVRSLAPRNFQNVSLAYNWRKHFDEKMYISLLQGMRLNMDGHRPVGPKCDKNHLFPYYCKDGSEVLADSFRISSLEVILRALRQTSISGPEMEACVASMVSYTCRSITESPQMMRDPGDVAKFAIEVLLTMSEMPEMRPALSLLFGPGRDRLDLPKLLRESARDKSLCSKLENAIRSAGVEVDGGDKAGGREGGR